MPVLAPSKDEILDAIREHGSWTQAAKSLGYSDFWLRKQLKKDPDLRAAADTIRAEFDCHGRRPQADDGQQETGSVHVTDDGAVITYPTTNPTLGDVGQLIRECGLDPDEWVVVGVTLNKWMAMTAPQLEADGERRNQRVPMNQWKVTLKRAPRLVLAMPAVHVPPVKLQKRPAPKDRPELIVVEGDHQVPYHDRDLHTASLYALQDLYARHNMRRHVFNGDLPDFPSISKHADHPAAMAPVNECVQGSYDVVRSKREVAPVDIADLIKGNHGWRLESELLLRSERMYGIRPASVNGEPEAPLLTLRNLLHLDALGIQMHEDPRGWQHDEIELVPGINGLVVRHGWLSGTNTAARSIAKRGRSMIVGHTHGREHVCQFDPVTGVERVGVVHGTMSSARGSAENFPHFAVCDDWLQGFVTVTVWPDQRFVVEHAIWDGEVLRWRDRFWKA